MARAAEVRQVQSKKRVYFFRFNTIWPIIPILWVFLIFDIICTGGLVIGEANILKTAKGTRDSYTRCQQIDKAVPYCAISWKNDFYRFFYVTFGRLVL